MKFPYRSPSVKAMERQWPGKGKALKVILIANRLALESMPAGEARVRECYHTPKTSDIRLHCQDAELGSFGVEAFQVKSGAWCEYLNTGDTYGLTLVRFRGNYTIASWGDIAERHGTIDG